MNPRSMNVATIGKMWFLPKEHGVYPEFAA